VENTQQIERVTERVRKGERESEQEWEREKARAEVKDAERLRQSQLERGREREREREVAPEGVVAHSSTQAAAAAPHLQVYSAYKCTRVRMHARIHTRTRAYMRVRSRVRAHTHIQILALTSTRTLTHPPSGRGMRGGVGGGRRGGFLLSPRHVHSQ